MNFAGLIEVILVLLIILGGVYSAFAIFCVLEFFGARREVAVNPSNMPVSILKPMKGIDPKMSENIRSFCEQEYPEYEVLLGFTDAGDSGIPTAMEMAASRPDSSIRVVINKSVQGVNKKVSNIKGLLDEAEYPLLAISDSDMRVDTGYLRRVAGEYQRGSNVGMVTSLYKISAPQSLGSAFESLTVALDFIPSVLVARQLEGVTFGLGASMLLSKQALQEIGGLSDIGDYLADDYQIGNRLWKKGYRIILSDYVIEDVVGDMGPKDYFIHQLRWARTYRASRPKGFVGYGITHIFPFSLALLLVQGPTALSLSSLGAVLALRLSLAYVVYRKVIGSKKWLRWLVLLPVKDLFSFGIWGWSFLGRRVFWRGDYYRIIEGGKIELCKLRDDGSS